VEIKYSLSAENLTAEEAIHTLPRLKSFNKKSPNAMNRNHRFFYQDRTGSIKYNIVRL